MNDAPKGLDIAGSQRRPGTLPVILVTGLSGAGKLTAMKALEDLGYETIDNLPLAFLAALLSPGAEHPARGVAINVDIRSRGFDAEQFLRRVESLRARPDLDLQVLFLDCAEGVLAQRYTETRRRHPMAEERPVTDGIALEQRLMSDIRDDADEVIDTTLLSINDLKRLIAGLFPLDVHAGLSVSVMSFSFKKGLPREADLVFDVRFLANPHWVPALRPGTGKDVEVGAHIMADPVFAEFDERVSGMLTFLVPLYRREGKSYLTIAFGCSGGRHRSVFMAERIGGVLRESGHRVTVIHRDTVFA
ncbi:RNase adapter RapZ [Zavarzinia aquatilis]|uniref:RNase adapter RapZ n=1 Tax=Zavarzinia aquatilis TaxID=2211142 RepID=A0A317EE56_9PROT|nr:RNase adapter RapZ [Zavarzinia aquatilis]PWR25031.1 RNase adapter RapZ [Zavarzinia aquatilis]